MARPGFEILNKSKDSYFVLDTDLTLISMKPQTCEMLGFECGELINLPLREIVTEKCYPRLRWAFEQSRHQASLFRRVYFRKRSGGALRIDYHLLNAFKENREIYVAVADRVNVPTQVTQHCNGGNRRCREIRALYKIGKLTHAAATSEEVLTGVARNLVWAIDHPQLTTSRVTFDGKEYFGSRRRPLPGESSIVSDLTIEGRKRGEIEIGRLKPALPFSMQTRELISELSSTVSKFLYRKEIERQLEKNSARLQTLFDAITDLLFMIDSNFNIKMLNREMDKIGQKCHRAFYGLIDPCPNCPAVIVNYTLEPAFTEKTLGPRTFSVSVYPILDSRGGLSDMVVRSREITQQKNLEQQLAQAGKLASLGELVSGIAHEINNPNTFIRGNVSIIAEALETILPLLDVINEDQPDLRIARLPYPYFREKISALVADMQKGANRIANIISDLREFARPDNEVRDEDVDINGVVEISRRLVHNQVKRTAQVHLDLAPELPLFKGNVQKMEQVLVNMIINASHAIEDRKATGNIWIRTFIDLDDNIHVHVRDDGVGMTSDVKVRLFDPFFTTKRHRKGTGLGLSIAYGIVTSFKGIIMVDSKPGKGSEFKIIIPSNPENSLVEGDETERMAAGRP